MAAQAPAAKKTAAKRPAKKAAATVTKKNGKVQTVNGVDMIPVEDVLWVYQDLKDTGIVCDDHDDAVYERLEGLGLDVPGEKMAVHLSFVIDVPKERIVSRPWGGREPSEITQDMVQEHLKKILTGTIGDVDPVNITGDIEVENYEELD